LSTPLLWILIPLLISGIFLFITNQQRIVKWAGTIVSLSLAALAAILPINKVFNYLFWELRVSDELLVFGRRFVLSEADRPIVVLFFLLCTFWFIILDPKIVPIQVIPLGLAGTALILTAYAVEPIFYGALFFAFLALINVVLLSPPGQEPTQGVLRFLVFQILGMLFILFAAWLASWSDLNSGDQLLLTRSLVILALGFSFLLAIFPFISWIPMIAEKNHPFVTGFVLNTYLLGVFLFGLRFITEAGWFGTNINIQQPLQIAGAMTLGFGGSLAIVSKHLGRMMAAVIISEIGRSLLAISLFLSGFPLFFAFVIVQALALGVLSLSLTHLRQGVSSFSYDSAAGAARQWPIISSGILVGYFTLAGLPLLAGFPLYWALGSSLRLFPLWINALYIFGILGLIVGGVRILAVLTRNSGEEKVLIIGNPFYRALILIVNVSLVLLGLFPQVVLRAAQSITKILLGS
jgi:NADH:ubiquinone oxidoreductase subunit 2 (subunit N)